jgi:DNA-binding Lrp family transcriptional regulator
MLTKRDRRVLRFIDDFNIVRTSDLKFLFFANVSLQRCQQRLTQLVKQKKLKRYRDYVSQDYLYYTGKKPDQIEHDLIRVEVYKRLSVINLQEFIPEFSYGRLRSDAYFIIDDQNWFLEVQLSTGFNQEKYEMLYRRLDWRERFEEFPSVLVVTNKRLRVEPSNIRFEVINVDSLDDINNAIGIGVQFNQVLSG